eukprot:SAG11_NODE_34539_length_271_cov_0.901163_1_plen_53_part_01
MRVVGINVRPCCCCCCCLLVADVVEAEAARGTHHSPANVSSAGQNQPAAIIWT